MCVSAFFYGHPSIAGDTLTRVGELVSLAAERGPGRSWVATRTHTPHESQEVCSHNKGERCKVVAVHAVKMTVPTQGSEVPSYIKRGLHTSCEPRGRGRARESQRGRAAEEAGGRERARGHKRACTQNAHTRSGAHPDRGLTLRAGRVTRADGGGVVRSPTGSCFKEFQTVSSGYGRFEWGAGGLTFDNSAVVVCITIIFLWLCTLSSPRVTAELNLAAD